MFQVSLNAVTLTLQLWECILVCYNEGMPRGSKPKLTPAQDQDVLAKYRSGMSIQKIADEYGLSITPISAALKRCGETRRASTDYRWQPTPENCAEVVRLWHEELGVQKIARKVGAGNVTVSRVLREAGITPRFSSRNRRFNKAQMAQLAADHIAGVSMAELARRHNCSVPSVRLTLKRAGVQIQHHGRAARSWTPERSEWLRKQHEAGRSQSSIAREIGYSQSAIGNKLRDLGLLVYERPSGPDHVSWQGGRTVGSQGYIRVKVMTEEDAALAGRTSGGGYVLEHRLVMARKLGRPLTKDETVHHIDGDQANNDPGNLQLRQGKHGNGVAVACLDCGSANVGAVPLH